MNGFERAKQRKRQSIMSAALELFRQHGFKRVGIYEIARSAGVSQVTMYRHFGSKENLVREVIKSFTQEIMDKYKEFIRGDLPFKEKLEAIILDKNKLASQFDGELLKSIWFDDPELRDYMEKLWKQEVPAITQEFFQQGRRQGYISKKISDESINLFFEVLRRGLVSSPDIMEQMRKKPRIIKDLISLYLYGLNG